MLRVLDSSLSSKWTIIKFLELCVMLEIESNSPNKIYFVSHSIFKPGSEDHRRLRVAGFCRIAKPSVA